MQAFNNSQELFDAGYAVPLYDCIENKTRWRYYDKKLTTEGPPLLGDTVKFRGNQLNVCEIKKVEKL
jgi:hypothetical protein